MTYEESFWAKVDKGSGSDCWVWTGALSGAALGPKFGNFRGKKAHRVSWLLENGSLPAEMDVCHHCDNTVCIRPDHLFLGTALDNVRDCISKGRFRRASGERHGLSKLTEDIVRNIRKRVASGETRTSLARELGCSIHVVSQAASRKTWRHVA